jgi:hypothetical protein
MKWHAPVGNQTAACECGPITYPLGPDALGLMMYTGDGYMSAQLMRRGRPAHSSARRYRNHQHSGVEMRPGNPTEQLQPDSVTGRLSAPT